MIRITWGKSPEWLYRNLRFSKRATVGVHAKNQAKLIANKLAKLTSKSKTDKILAFAYNTQNNILHQNVGAPWNVGALRKMSASQMLAP
jgi:hypothetical protein